MKYVHVRTYVYITNHLHLNVYLPASHACAACEHASAVLTLWLLP
jgi:hypothetical protein